MADQDTGAEDIPIEGDEGEIDDQGNPTPKKGSENGKDGEGSDEGEGDGAEDDKGAPDPKDKKDDDEVVPVRKSKLINQSHAFERIKRKGQQGGKQDQGGGEGDGGAGDGADQGDKGKRSDQSRDDLISALNEALDPIREALGQTENEGHLGELYANEPEAKKYDKQIRRYMKTDEYKGVPAEVIYHHLAFAEAAKIGAQKKDIADKDAKGSRAGGHGRRPTKVSKVPTAEEIDDMSDEEIGKIAERVQRGDFS